MKLPCPARLAALAALLVFPLGVAAATPRVSLFDGKSLAGWTLVTCKAEVKDGCIFIESGNGLVQTEKKYRDFVLEFDWKPLKAEKWDSGIYFRYLAVAGKRPWPQRYQINLRQGEEGNLVGDKTAQSKGLIKERDWNKMKLTVRGTRVALEINGKPAWDVDGLQDPAEGFIGLQAEVPGGGQHLFRNIYLTAL